MRHILSMLILTILVSTTLWGQCNCKQNKCAYTQERLTDGINCKCLEMLPDGINCRGYEFLPDGINCKGYEFLPDGINCICSELLLDGINCGWVDFSECHYVCTSCGWKSTDSASECPQCGSSNIQLDR